ncbi:anhydro-N-acetylmuramic acid kinase [Pseudohoeflea coraliihabitans]|uniref:Anhydro-N-acetylmuramic acid kinase n=1 Tax=Pseudohoeflea coraliihabitans TaxID=2860393 RepID=A0ABS6WR14_9HYPH|nr:anhydro-N-acetylmuramic acid kinase [Pseudohoeflea sp. DP4N28-3]MBW3098365.1 anhydro-N-acetylmuramic acid kinase [Pseudohoeflea sp. DP4N28-3]
MAMKWAIGLMTGTVLDGNIDIAMLQTDGARIAAFGPWQLAPYPDTLRADLQATLAAARDWRFQGPEPALFASTERALSEAQSEAVAHFLDQHGFSAGDIAAIGFHGQTVLHQRPGGDGKRGQTRQLGDGALMAERLGIEVVYDFRSADMAAGGQGAPLSPIYHKAMLERIGADTGTAILNLGGVANLTWHDGERLIAFDTGPANAPVNDWIGAHTGAEMDRDGKIATSGSVDADRLAQLLDHPYLSAGYPKSLDRFDFPSSMADGLSLADGAATLTAFSAAAVARGLDLLPQRLTRLVVCGGGRRNPQLMAELAARTGVNVVPAETVGLRGDAVEAECFAFLAMRTRAGLPISFPLTTGVPAPLAGGRIALPPRLVAP